MWDFKVSRGVDGYCPSPIMALPMWMCGVAQRSINAWKPDTQEIPTGVSD